MLFALDAIENDNVDELERLLQGSKVLHFNRERGALEVRDCGGRTIRKTFLPLTFVARLASRVRGT